MVPARLAWVLLLIAACVSRPATDAAVTLNGVVTNVDLVHQTITVSEQSGETRSQNDVHYNTLTIVDTPHGSVHVDQLEVGANVIVHGRRDVATDEITADRIVVTGSTEQWHREGHQSL